MTLIQPEPDCPVFSDLTMQVREEVRQWLWAFREYGVAKPIGRSLERIATALGVSPKTARRKYDALRNSGWHWTALMDLRKGSLEAADEARTADREFRNYLATLAEKFQRKSRPAIRALHRAWAARQRIPGYEDLPGWPELPEGWSQRNLARLIKETSDARHLASIRISTTSKTRAGSLLPQVFTTRVGLWPGAVIQLDDMWHDNYVTIGRSPITTRVLELGALDLFSGCRFHWGAKPRMPKADGTGMEGLKEREMRFFVAAILWNYGFSKQGTVFMSERGTAVIGNDVAAILSDATQGLIDVRYQPIEGQQKALTGFWKGSEGGNFRAKAALESIHNLIHNELAFLDLQTGSPSSGLAAPVTTDIQLSYIARIVKSVAEKRPDRLGMLRLPGMDFHAKFLPFLADFYEHGLNGRTDHELEGWGRLGFHTTEYTALPGSGQWLTASQFLDLPLPSQAIIRSAVQQDPRSWSRPRALSPREVWKPAVPDLQRIAPHVVCDILSRDLAREQKVEGSYIRFKDLSISPDELIYESRVRTVHGAWRELPSGESYLCFANPFAPKQMFICDAKGALVGIAPLAKTITANDDAAIAIEAGHKHARTADILQPLRIRHEEAVRDAREMQEHNKRVNSSASVTPEEIAEARSESGKKAASTRRVNQWAEELPEDNPYVDVPAEDDTPPISTSEIASYLND